MLKIVSRAIVVGVLRAIVVFLFSCFFVFLLVLFFSIFLCCHRSCLQYLFYALEFQPHAIANTAATATTTARLLSVRRTNSCCLWALFCLYRNTSFFHFQVHDIY